jgi:hypothetical protein
MDLAILLLATIATTAIFCVWLPVFAKTEQAEPAAVDGFMAFSGGAMRGLLLLPPNNQKEKIPAFFPQYHGNMSPSAKLIRCLPGALGSAPGYLRLITPFAGS